MKQIGSKSQLAVALSRLKGFEEPNVRQEQYATDSEVAGHMLWNAYMLGDIEGKVVADLGCGTGILGIGAILLGAKKVLFIDMDKKALESAKSNLLQVESESSIGKLGEFICQGISEAKVKAETVIQNPPFGTKIKHNDAVFLEKALEIAPVVYSLHKSESKAFLEGFSAKNNAKITHIWDFKFPLKATMKFHRRQIRRIDVSCFRFEKNQ